MTQISKIGIPGNRLSAGVGWLYIPKDLPRDKFIDSCYKNGTVSFITENSERFDNVKVSKQLFQELVFPDKGEVLGSEVFWVLTPKYKQPVIVAILMKNGEILNVSEGQFLFSRKSTEGYVEVSGSVNSGSNLILKVESEVPQGKIILSSVSRDQTGEIEIHADSLVRVDSENKVEVHSATEIELDVTDLQNTPNDQTKLSISKDNGFTYVDAFENRVTIDSDGVMTFFPKTKFKICQGTEPIPLGNTLKENLDKEKDVVTQIINALKNIQAVNVAPNTPDATWEALKTLIRQITDRGSYDNINSEISFID